MRACSMDLRERAQLDSDAGRWTTTASALVRMSQTTVYDTC